MLNRLKSSSFTNCIDKVLPVPVFPYKNKLLGLSPLSTGARIEATCFICSSLYKISSGLYLVCKIVLSLKITFLSKESKISSSGFAIKLIYFKFI